MGMRLVSRQHQIPGGFRFYQPETKWRSSAFASFDTIVQGLVAHRRGNPALCAKHGWATDPAQVADEVDRYNALVCSQMGWTKFIATGGGPLATPKALPLSPLDPKQVSVVAAKIRKI